MTDTTSNVPSAADRVRDIVKLARSVGYGRVKIETVAPPASREEYLAERVAFRTAYAATAEAIREAKRERSQSTRETLRVEARGLIAIRLRAREHARQLSRQRMEETVPVPATAA